MHEANRTLLLRILSAMGGIATMAGCDRKQSDVGQTMVTDHHSPTTGTTSQSGPYMGTQTDNAELGVGIAPDDSQVELLPALPSPPPIYWLRAISNAEAEQWCSEGLDRATPLEVCFAPGQMPTAPGATDVCSAEQARSTAQTRYMCGLGFRASSVCGAHAQLMSTLGPNQGSGTTPESSSDSAEQVSDTTAMVNMPRSEQVADAGLLQSGNDAAISETGANDAVPTQESACCWVVAGSCRVGRPFTIDGEARHAAVRTASRVDWTRPGPPLDNTLSEEQRRLIGECWLRDAQSEHASVASFARFTLQCLALGAPVDLVMAAQKATQEEIEHARLSFGLAARYLGQTYEPTALDVSGALDATDWLSVTLAVVSEGCIAETVSAVLLTGARDAALDPHVKNVLSRLVDEELAHAELAWKFLTWALTAAPHLAERVSAVFAKAESHIGLGELHHDGPNDAMLRAHGCLPRDELRQLARQALAEVVRPAATGLLEWSGARVQAA